MAYILYTLGILSVVGFAASQHIPYGKRCPDVKTQENFDLNRYLGKWYENRRYFNWFSFTTNCVTAEYSPLTETMVQVKNSGFSNLTGEYTVAIGKARIENGSKLGVRFADSDFVPWGKYWVLATDYDTYSIVWSCDDTGLNILPLYSQYLWILTRKPEGLPDAETEKLLDILRAYDIEVGERVLRKTRQTRCPERPMDM